MQYEFPVQSGKQVEVRLYFYDGYAGTNAPGDRVFDLSVEDQTVEDFDIVDQYADDTGAMKSFTVTSDGTIDIDFAHVTENPQINAIEIVSVEPQPDTLGGPGGVDFGTVVTGSTKTETVTVTNLGDDGDSSIDISDVSVSGSDTSEFSTGAASQTTLAPGESADIPVTFSPSNVAAKSATLEVTHSGNNTPLTVDLSGEGASSVPVGFSKSNLQGFSAGAPTALEFGPDGRLYVSTQGGTVYVLSVERTGDDTYDVTNEVQIDAIKDVPNHDDNGNYVPGETNRQITGLTVGGTASQPIVYVSSSDPSTAVGDNNDDTDTNSGTISRLTISPGGDGVIQQNEIDHEVLVMGLPRSEENHATNGLDLSPDGDTLYVAQGGNTNKGAPSNNFGQTPEFALSAAILDIDLAQIESNYQPKSLQGYDAQGSSQSYPDLDFYYAIPTIKNDDATDGDDLPFGGDDGANMAKIVEGGPVQVYSPGYRNPYDLVLTESGQIYASDHGPNGGWGGQPVDANGNIVTDAASVTNHPNEDGSFNTNDQLVKVDEGSYGGHASPIRANPTGADIYDANGNVVLDITESNSPVPQSEVDPRQADYIPPTSGSPDPGAPAGSANTMRDVNNNVVTLGPTGAIDEYTASNFGGSMVGDLLQVELGGSIKRVQLSADGSTVADVSTIFNANGPLGLTAQGDNDPYPGTVWTANHGSSGVTIFEPNDYGDDGGSGQQCTGADDASLDEDGDGYDNADEIDAGTDPCASASTPADFDGDGTSNLNDPDDDDDGTPDTSDPFAVDPDDGTTTTLPIQYDLSELSLLGENGQGWTGLMTNGNTDYQSLYDPSKMTVGGAAEVLTVEQVPKGDATQDDQQYAFQFGVDAPDQPFTVHTTVNGLPENPEDYQGLGIYVGNGDQDNYVKLISAANTGTGGVQFAKETDGTFTNIAQPDDSNVTGPSTNTDLYLTVDPTTDPNPNNGQDEVAVTAKYAVDGGAQTEVATGAIPASWLDSADGTGLAVGVISTSYGSGSTFDATWTDFSVEYVNPPANTAPVADAGSDQTVDEGAQVTLDASDSSDSDGDQLGYTWAQSAGPDVSLSVNDAEQTTFTAPEVDSETTLTFQLSVSDGTNSTADTVNVTVQDTDAPAQSGDVVFAVNSGGSEYTAADGTVYAADTNYDNGQTYSVSSSPEIGNTDDDTLYYTERYGDPLNYTVPLDDGTYRVTLEFAEIFQGVSSNDSPDSAGPTDGTNENDRVFSANVEGTQVLDEYDLYADVGSLNATSETTTVEVTDGALNIDFAATYDNAKVSAIKVVNVTQTDETLTIPESVARLNDAGDDSTIDTQEISQAINLWSTGTEVPETGGQTIDTQMVSELINLWSTSATVGDGGSDDGGETGDGAIGSALAEVTPGSSNIAETTYGKGSYQVTNTGEKNITSVSFDLSSASYPDMVFDPQGTAGDPTGDGLTVVDEGGTGITTAEGGSDAFSQPHNGQNADDGYDVMTVEFDEFQPGEMATFWADNDPTSIKGATIGSQEAGPVSGLELTGSTVTVTYQDGTTQTTQLMGDGSVGGSTANVTADESAAPTIGAAGVSLDSSVLDARHSAATVSSADQTITVTGQPGETVTLVRAEGELTLSNVPDADNDGQPGYDIEAYEANNAQNVEYYTTTLDANGEAEIDVTLTNTTSDGDDNAGYNYITAVQGEPAADAGLTSNVIVLKFGAVSSGTGNAAPSLNAVADQTVIQGETEQFPVSASDADGDSLSLSTNAPAFVTLNDTGDGSGTLTVAPQSGDAGTYTVDVTADDGTAQTTESFQLTVDEGTSVTDGDVAYRVNAGSSTTVPATDSGPDWTGVSGTSSDYLDSVGSESSGNYCNGDDVTPTSSVPSSTPDAVYNCERYGTMEWSFPTDSGQEVEVRLYLSNQFPGSSQVGQRTFNVSIEGTQVLTQYDPVADVGHANGTVKAFTVSDENGDGAIDISFETGAVENPQVNAIEVVNVSGGSGGSTTGSADFAVNQNGGIDASTYGGGSMESTNTGDERITSVTYDLSSSVLPDIVFDPQGSAGDSVGKGFTPNSGESAVAPTGSFAAPHNGQDGSDGYDELTVDFGDFESGESFAFSTDIDPTSIKNAQGSGYAGSVSGLELSGATVTVQYADGSTQTTTLFGDGSDGGSQATAKANIASAPTIGAAGVSLDSSALDARHSAATVSSAGQTITVSGPAGATVELIQVEGQLELANQAQGYDLEAYEANTAENVDYETVTLDGNGEATVDVTLTNTSSSGAEGGFNHFVATVQDDDGDTGDTSNVVVLKYEGGSQ